MLVDISAGVKASEAVGIRGVKASFGCHTQGAEN